MGRVVINVPPGECLCIGPYLTGGIYGWVCDTDLDGVIVVEVPDGGEQETVVGAPFTFEPEEEEEEEMPRITPPFSIPAFSATLDTKPLILVNPQRLSEGKQPLTAGQTLVIESGKAAGLPWITVKDLSGISPDSAHAFEELPDFNGSLKVKSITTFSIQPLENEKEPLSSEEVRFWRNYVLSMLVMVQQALAFLAFIKKVSRQEQSQFDEENILHTTLKRLNVMRVVSDTGQPRPGELIRETEAILQETHCYWQSRSIATDEVNLNPFGVDLPVNPVAISISASVPPILPSISPTGAAPIPIPPQVVEEIELLIAHLRNLISSGIIDGDEASELERALRELEALIERWRQGRGRIGAIMTKLSDIVRRASEILRRLGTMSGKLGQSAKGGLETLIRIIGRIGGMLPRRLLVFLGPIFAILMSAELGWAMGSAIAEIEVGEGETVGTWWGKQFWELVKGPCPELLEALNIAILVWRMRQARGASDEEVASALNRVMLLEDEYIRRCLEQGSEEWRQEMLFLRQLRREYRQLLERLEQGTPESGVQP